VMLQNPNESPFSKSSDQVPETILSWFAIRLIGVPICGATVGAVSGACMGATVALIELTPAHFIEWGIGALYLAVVGTIYGIQAGLIACVFSVPMQLIMRRRRYSDAIVVLLLSSAFFWWFYFVIERDNNWEPRSTFLLLRITTSAITCSVVVWLFGTNHGILTSAKIERDKVSGTI
jgi:hypothetical protein